MEVLGVSGCECRLVGMADCSDLRIEAVDGRAGTVSGAHYCGIFQGCPTVERENLVSEHFEDLVGSIHELILPTSGRQPLDAVANFGHRDRRGGQRRRVRTYPCDDCRFRRRLHKLRGDVRVEDDHEEKSAARGGVRRDGNSRSTPPRSPNRWSRALNRFSDGSGSLTAWTRIARISASIDQPWRAARIRNRSRTW